MIGKNAVPLILPDEYAQLHPVFNVSLIMPYFADTSTQQRAPIISDISDREALDFISNWVAVEFITVLIIG